MRSYGQYCSVAKALDVVGERWTLLVIRELLIQGPCRYTDLKNGLPGIATNLLAERLKDLEEANLIRREAAPPPIATTLFHLTDLGRALEPVLRELGQWGIQYMIEPSEDDQFRSHWFTFPTSLMLTVRDPAGPPLSIELRTGDEPVVHLALSDSRIVIEPGPATSPDLVMNGTPHLILGALSGYLSLDEARALGLEATGDEAVLSRVQSPRDHVDSLLGERP